MGAKKIVSLMLVWSMLFTPAVHAEGDAIQGILGAIGEAMGQFQQSQVAQQSAMQQQIIMSQMNPRLCNGRACTSTIFPECSILASRTNAVETPACTEMGGPNLQQSGPVQQAKLQEAVSYFQHYSQVENLYENQLTRANQPSAEGITCLENQATALENRLKNRENEIDNLIARMQLAHDQFKHQVAQARLIEQVEDSQAILSGKPQNALDRVTTQNNLRFAQPFQDPGCQSVMGSDRFNELGRSGGLLNIEKELTSTANKKEGQGRGSFNAMEFTGTVAAAVEQDIRRVASLQERQISSAADIGAWLSGRGGGPGTSTYGLDAQNGPLSSIVEEQRQEAGIRNSELATEIAAFSTGESMSASIRGNSDEAFNLAITVFETGQKNNCLSGNENITNLLTGKVSMFNRGASSHANENAHNEFLNFIKQTLANRALTMEDKMSRIQAEQGRGNQQYSMRLGGSLVVSNKDGSTRSIPPTESLSPAAFIGYIAQNCEQQFNENPNSQGVTGRQVVERARTARANYTNFRRGLGSAVSAAIINRSVNCADTVQANATGVNTCNPAALNAGSGAFCVRRALSCANNMRNCMTSAKNEVQRITTQRDGQVRTYKTALETHKQGMRAMYMTITNILATEGLQMQNSPLRHALVLPTDVQLVPDFAQTSKNFIENLKTLEMEDPDKYFQLTKANLEKLKKALEKQRKNVMEGDKSSSLDTTLAEGVRGHIKQVEENMKDAKKRAKDQAKKCEQAIKRYTDGVREQMAQAAQAQGETAAAQNEVCSAFNAIDATPTCDSVDELDSINDAAARASSNYRAVNSFKRYCDRANRDAPATASTFDRSTVNRSQKAEASRGCVANDSIEACQRLNAFALCKVNEPFPTSTTGLSDNQKAYLRSLAELDTAARDTCVQNDEYRLSEECLEKLSESSMIARATGSLAAIPEGSLCSESEGDLQIEVLSAQHTIRAGGTVSTVDEDEAEWRRLTSSLGENRTNNCQAQDNEGGGVNGLLESVLEGINSPGLGTTPGSATGG